MYKNIIWLCMIKARIRWYILTLGKLLSLWFCFLLHSILFLISQTSYRTYKNNFKLWARSPHNGNHFSSYKTKHFGRRYKSTKSTYFRWIATDWYKFCKYPLTCFRIIFVDFLVHTVKLKPIIKDQIPGKLVNSGISDIATASVHSEKTWAKKWIMIIIIITRARKRAG